LISRGRQGCCPWKATEFRCFQRCQQQSNVKVDAVSAGTMSGAAYEKSFLTSASAGKLKPSARQKPAANPHPKIRWFAVSSSPQIGQRASAAVRICLRSRELRDCIRALERSQAKKRTFDGAWFRQTKSWVGESTPPKDRSPPFFFLHTDELLFDSS
jgi:hypothetical protein